MDAIQFYMAGSGHWQKWFPDDATCAFYERLYPGGESLDDLDEAERRHVAEWEKPGFVDVEDGRVAPRTPIYTDADHHTLSAWYARATERATETVAGRQGDYRDLARALSDGGRIPEDHVLTILICAHTLDEGTLGRLTAGVMGEPPQRADTGAYFFWGETAERDLAHYFGVNTYGLLGGMCVAMLWSHTIQRAIPDGPSLTIPVFGPAAMRDVREVCGNTAEELAGAFTAGLADLEAVLPECSFASCSRNDVLCMLFHIGYGLVADQLAAAGILPEFPARADDSWGLWIHPQEP